MDPSNYYNISHLWHDAANKHITSMDKKVELFEFTEAATKKISGLCNERSKKSAAETAEINSLCDIILEGFNQLPDNGLDVIAKWMVDNSPGDNAGAQKVLNVLMETIAKIKKIPNPLQPPPAKSIRERIVNFSQSIVDFWGGPSNIDGITEIGSKFRNMMALQQNKKNWDSLPKNITRRIISEYVDSHPPKNTSSLKQASKETRLQVAKAYRGPLETLNIQTADQAIEYVKEFGKELHYINISSIAFDDESKLAELIKYLPKLSILFALGCKISAEGAKVIAESENLKNLAWLGLSHNQIGDAGAKDIAASKYLKKLVRLSLRHSQIGDGGVKEIIASENIKTLSELNLDGNQIGDAGLEDIADSEHLQNLTSLYLAGNQIGDAGAKGILASKYLIKLANLDLSENEIGDAGLEDIGAFEYMKTLSVLNLSNNQIGDAGAKYITDSKNLKKLVKLNLYLNEIGDAGAKNFADSKNLKKLAELDLSLNKIGAAGKQYITASEYLRNVAKYDFNNQLRSSP